MASEDYDGTRDEQEALRRDEARRERLRRATVAARRERDEREAAARAEAAEAALRRAVVRLKTGSRLEGRDEV